MPTGDERGPQYMASYLESVLEHYEIMGDHFEGLKGYDAYARAATVLRRMGETRLHEGLPRGHRIGHARTRSSRRTGPATSCSAASRRRRRSASAACPFEEAEASMRLFAAEVLPELQSWT